MEEVTQAGEGLNNMVAVLCACIFVCVQQGALLVHMNSYGMGKHK